MDISRGNTILSQNMDPITRLGRKIPDECENPVDRWIINQATWLSPIFSQSLLTNTPNKLTTISLITGLLSVYLYLNSYHVLSAIMYFTTHAFDCFDGYYARRYDMVTKFGDWYDHITDVITYSSLTILVCYNYWSQPLIIIILFILSMITSIQLDCQEIYYDGDSSEGEFYNIVIGKMLECIYRPKTKKEAYYVMKNYTKYLGCATNVLYLCLIIMFSP